MKRAPLAVLAACILVGVASLPAAMRASSILAFASSIEAIHVVAHVLLYGGATLLARRAGASPAMSMAAALGIAAVQEGIQVAQSGRSFYGAPEAFDFAVDAAASIGALALFAPGRARWRSLFRANREDAKVPAHADAPRAPLLTLDGEGALRPRREADRLPVPHLPAAPRRTGVAAVAAQAHRQGERPGPRHR